MSVARLSGQIGGRYSRIEENLPKRRKPTKGNIYIKGDDGYLNLLSKGQPIIFKNWGHPYWNHPAFRNKLPKLSHVVNDDYELESLDGYEIV